MLKDVRSNRTAGLLGSLFVAAVLAFAAAPAMAATELPTAPTTTTKPKSTAPATTPKPANTSCTQFTRGSTKWKKCIKAKNASLSDDDRYYAAYWLAKSGEFASAIDMLKTADNADDPRILNMIGYSTRKLGDVDAALPYYHKALNIDPNYHVAREYLGEGYLQKGDLPSALGQLNELANRCGTSCEAYVDLLSEVEAYRKSNAL